MAGHVRHLFIVAAPRTGSNRLTWAFRLFPDCYSLSEFFHESGVWGVKSNRMIYEKFVESSGVIAGEEDEDDIVNYVQENPLAAYKLLAECAADHGSQVMVVKIFAEQLKTNELAELLRLYKPYVIILERNWLDSAISFWKARSSGHWLNKNSTNHAIDVTLNDIQEFYQDNMPFYRYIAHEVHEINLDHKIVRYESMIDTDDSHLLDLTKKILHENGLDLLPDLSAQHYWNPTKQDHSKTSFDKVLNGDALKQSLIEAGWLEKVNQFPTDEIDSLGFEL